MGYSSIADIRTFSAKFRCGMSCFSFHSTALALIGQALEPYCFTFYSWDQLLSQRRFQQENIPNTRNIKRQLQDSFLSLLPKSTKLLSKIEVIVHVTDCIGSFHMKFPLLFASVDKSKVKQFREKFKAILYKAFWGFADVEFDILWDLMKMIELVSDDSNEISHWLVVIFSIIAHFSNLYSEKNTKVKWNSFIQGVLITL